MSEQILDLFLEKGLLDLKGNDEWYGHITAASRSMTEFLKTNPKLVIPFTYAAIHPKVDDTNEAVRKSRELLRAEWKTFASVTVESPTFIFRAITLNALLEFAQEDERVESLIAMLLVGTLPYVNVEGEEEFWTNLASRLLHTIECKAEKNWAVSSQIDIEKFPKFRIPAIYASVTGLKTDEGTLRDALFAASGPHNRESEPLSENPNPNWPHQGQEWSWEFAPRAAQAISRAIADAKNPRAASLNAKAFVDAWSSTIVNYLDTVVGRLVSTSMGLETRANLLWWKESFMSPSARKSYRDINSETVPGLMAYDFHLMVPTLAPASASAFLCETVRRVDLNSETKTILEWLKALASLSYANSPKEAISQLNFANGYLPLIALVVEEEISSNSIEQLTVFSPSMNFAPWDFSLLVFLELQAIKIVHEIEAYEPDEEDKD